MLPAVTRVDLEKIRKDFPILKRMVNGKPLAYLDNAATTQKPEAVLKAVDDLYRTHHANVHRGAYTLSVEASELYENAHKKVAEHIGAKSYREIVFTRNATEAANIVAYGWGWWRLREDDEVLVSLMEHHSDIVPWLALKKARGIRVRFINVLPDGTLDMEDLRSKLTPKTRLVGVVHASNVLGTINPVAEICRTAHENGSLVLVDAAQSAPHLPLNVRDLDCDFLIASGHKMMAPSGIGFLYAKRNLLEEMEPFHYGGDMILTVTTEEATWNELPWKFEAGTPNISGGVGLGAAIDYLRTIGMEAIHARETELTTYAYERLSALPWVTIYGPPPDRRVSVISFNVDGVHPHDVSSAMDEEGICIRSGHHCAQPLMAHLDIIGAARVSFAIYNTIEEIDRFIEVLHRVHALFA
ncbi:MAG: cysteine desulfurase [bacterium JZ-2024 1]